jgi:peroxiredoxin Q/BCP
MTLRIGDKVPVFKGLIESGAITHKDLLGSVSVLYFYPKDDTPGCTLEACAFRDTLPKFKKMNARVFGISKDSLPKHKKFADKYELPFTLISDEDGSICESFGTWMEKSMYGKKYMGIDRATFLVDEQGIIREIWRKVKVSGHVEAVLESVKSLAKSKA